jgi:hypothetical protein
MEILFVGQQLKTLVHNNVESCKELRKRMVGQVAHVRVIHGAKNLKENMFWLFCEEV